MEKINIALVGYGNVGRGVEEATKLNADTELVAVLTRRPEQVRKELKEVPVFHIDEKPEDIQIDVAILCGGSKEDIPVQGPKFAERFNTVDSFDMHAEIPSYFQKMDSIAKERGHVHVISAGWDPEIFSLMRVLGDAFLPQSKQYTFWGEGVSQGHSDAARKVKGVLDARAYTIPIEQAVQRVRTGETPEFAKREQHKRLVYVVAEEGADIERIRKDIATMPHYYDEYDTEVLFISKEAMLEEHSKLPHGGFVLTSGVTGEGNKQILEYRCQLESNPEFTANVLVACARAAFRLSKEGRKGAFTMLDIAPGYLSPHSAETLRKSFM
ncbi:diaminopimelate dehydrogenase [Candidatus Methanophagaceae archaeon]|nr:diaminopimelate dehydrogenase [Methanophagales archaeon]